MAASSAPRCSTTSPRPAGPTSCWSSARSSTAGSTWHSAGGMHTLNGDPNVSKLQQYTIELYQRDRGPLRPGLLDPPARRADAGRRPRAARLAAHGPGPRPLPRHGAGDHHAGRGQGDVPADGGAVLRRRAVRSRSRATSTRPASPTPTPSAPARPAPRSTATRWVNDLRQRADGTWDVVTDQGEIHAEHIVNAGGLWAREVGRMIGIELPVLGHGAHVPRHRAMAEVAEHNAAHRPRDADGARLRRRDLHPPGAGRDAARAPTSRRACRGRPQDTPWGFDMELLPPDLDRIAPSLEVAFKHYPAMATAGIKRIVNGPVHVRARRQPAGRPDPGHPQLLGGLRGDGRAVPGRRRRPRAGQLDDRRATPASTSGAWTSPASATGPPSPTPTPRCGRTTAAASGSRSPTRSCRRPGRCTPRPVYDRLTEHNAVWGAGVRARARAVVPAAGRGAASRTSRSGAPTPSRSWPRSAAAVRERVGLTEMSNFAKYRVTGAGRRGLAAGAVHQPAAEGRAASP